MAEFPDWIADPTAWNQVGLGDIYIPGICTITEMQVGRKIDHKKTKGKDKAKTTDNGTEPAKLTIESHMTADDWALWLQVLPKIQPRQAGGAREPLVIRHPDPNHLGIEKVYVSRISMSPPSARGGRLVRIECGEWVPAPKAVKKKTTTRPGTEKYFGDPDALARDMYQNEHPLEEPRDPNDELTIRQNALDANN